MLLTKEVEVSLWNNAEYYENLGYTIPKYYNKNKKKMVVLRDEKITIKLEHLHKGSATKVTCLCDYCLDQGVETIIYKNYQHYVKQLDNVINKDCCNKCKGKKISESVFKKYGVTNTTQIKEVAKKLSNSNKTRYDIIVEAFKNRGYIIITSEEEYYNRIDKRNKIEYICPKHSEKGVLSIPWDNFINQNSGCRYCGYDAIGLTKRKHTISSIRKLFKDEGYTLISEIYVNNAEKLEYICPKHGKKFISLGHFLSGKRCKDCQHEKITDSQRHSIDDVKRIINMYDSDIKIIDIIYSSYKNNSITIECKNCKKEFITRLPFILNGKVRCDCCSNAVSSSEYYTEDYLMNKNIYYEREISFEDCKHINKLTFDFGIYDNNESLIFLIELDGQQHFKLVRFGGISEEDANEQFARTKIRDNIKNEYCFKNNIPLIRIPYWDFDKIDKILHIKLKKYKLIE